MQIVINLPHVFNTDSPSEENADVLRALLDCLIDINLAFLRKHPVPGLYRSGVSYGRTDIWEPIPALYLRGFGDCKSLSTALIAEYRLAGVEAIPVFRWFINRHGIPDFHILVQTPNGFEDPSRILGMGQNEYSNIVERSY